MNSKSETRPATARERLYVRKAPVAVERACRVVNAFHLVLTVLPALWVLLVVFASLVFFKPVGALHGRHGHDRLILYAATRARPPAFDLVDALGWAQFAIVPIWAGLTITVKQPIVGLRRRWRTIAFLAGVAGIAIVLLAIHIHLIIW